MFISRSPYTSSSYRLAFANPERPSLRFSATQPPSTHLDIGETTKLDTLNALLTEFRQILDSVQPNQIISTDENSFSIRFREPFTMLEQEDSAETSSTDPPAFITYHFQRQKIGNHYQYQLTNMDNNNKLIYKPGQNPKVESKKMPQEDAFSTALPAMFVQGEEETASTLRFFEDAFDKILADSAQIPLAPVTANGRLLF